MPTRKQPGPDHEGTAPDGAGARLPEVGRVWREPKPANPVNPGTPAVAERHSVLSYCAEQTLFARTSPAAAPLTALAGTWKRTFDDTSAAPPAGSPGNPTSTHTPTGTYTLAIEKRWIQTRFPGSYVLPASEAAAARAGSSTPTTPPAQTFSERWGSVVFRQFHDEAEGGQWCWQTALLPTMPGRYRATR